MKIKKSCVYNSAFRTYEKSRSAFGHSPPRARGVSKNAIFWPFFGFFRVFRASGAPRAPPRRAPGPPGAPGTLENAPPRPRSGAPDGGFLQEIAGRALDGPQRAPRALPASCTLGQSGAHEATPRSGASEQGLRRTGKIRCSLRCC